MSDALPAIKPACPNFSSGPCAKRPGYNINQLDLSTLGRSHRSKQGKDALQKVITDTAELLNLPEGYRVGIVPASDTGAMEMIMWSMLGPRAIDICYWESFGQGWYGDITSGSLNICRIGCQERTSKDSFVNGNLDEVAVWDSALSSSQISTIYNSGTPNDISSLLPRAWWRMGDGAEANSGTTIYDMSSFSNNMNMVSSPAYQTDAP